MPASSRDFDFLRGTWQVANQRLKQRRAGSDDWDHFPATSVFQTLLDGVANVDEFDCPARGFKGMSLRTLDLARGVWSIYWVNSTQGILRPPVHGSFADGHGEFFGEDMDDGIPVHCRFRWTVSETAPVWEQAFSTDGGQSWETNWFMRFSRP